MTVPEGKISDKCLFHATAEIWNIVQFVSFDRPLSVIAVLRWGTG
jgi:hypothetical protein